MEKSRNKLWMALFILALFTPLGVILPSMFKSGGSWGEWRPEELQLLLGYVPRELRRLAGLWKPPFSDYTLGPERNTIVSNALSYLGSGLLGILGTVFVVYILWRFIIKNGK